MIGSSSSPCRLNAHQLTAVEPTAATAPIAAPPTIETKGRARARSSDSATVNRNSPPGAQSGRLSRSFIRIWPTVWACSNTPGVAGDSGVATMS